MGERGDNGGEGDAERGEELCGGEGASSISSSEGERCCEDSSFAPVVMWLDAPLPVTVAAAAAADDDEDAVVLIVDGR